MAGAGYKTFVAGQILSASEVNTYLMEQSVMVFGSTAGTATPIRSSVLPSPADGMVTYIKATDTLEIYDGANWQVIGSTAGWTSYTPTLSGCSQGNGTLSFAYAVNGKTTHLRGRFTLGSTSSVTGSVSFTLPNTPSAAGFGFGTAAIVSAGLNYTGVALISGSSVVIGVHNAAGTYATRNNLSGTVPNTFTTADSIAFSLTYLS